MRAIATESWLISSCDRNFITCAAASSPIDIMTTADFSISVRLTRLFETVSVTSHPPSYDLRRARRVVVDQRLHGFGLDAEHVLRGGENLGGRLRQIGHAPAPPGRTAARDGRRSRRGAAPGGRGPRRGRLHAQPARGHP